MLQICNNNISRRRRGEERRRLPERCESMDKHYGNVFEPGVGGYGSYMGSPGLVDDSDAVSGHGKRKGSGIKMFGDLWKKKGHK
ncbi:hypothetical protein R3W88_029534 [Solanum pinnatisectum]|uniref:Uncharacterized protein n=1 Tax=Solanum pinnatisectum TaxID=50273 RepID=A0AAV9K5U8_9SOLN|nr:hypothetical protein R3W88_029534 [Solanum pinnatisectum]